MKSKREMALMAHRYAAAKATDAFVLALAEFFRQREIDTEAMLVLAETAHSHAGLMSTQSEKHMELFFNVKYGKVVSEEVYQRAKKEVEKYGSIIVDGGVKRKN